MVVIGQFHDTLYIVDDHEENGQAFMKTISGPIEFKRGPIAWNPVNRNMLDKLCMHITDNLNPNTEIRYNMHNGEASYFIRAPGRAGHEVHRRHPWHPDYG